jgi:hypothetical protein
MVRRSKEADMTMIMMAAFLAGIFSPFLAERRRKTPVILHR